MMEKFKKLYYLGYFLPAYKFVIEDKVVFAFYKFLKILISSHDFEENIASYSYFISELFQKKYCDFSKYLSELLENNSPNMLYEGYDLNKELEIINKLFEIKFEEIKSILIKKFSDKSDFIENLPKFESSISKANSNIINATKDIFEKNRAFIFDNDFEIKPVQIYEDIKFSDLKGYKEQKKILYDNTLALLNGTKVNNILLYGDAGCGKSSSVRALLNEFKEIKIVQIFKNNLIHLDKLYKKLSEIPYKFIIFADDISFDDTDSTISTMKAILEGSLIQCPANATIYATSNRRHIVRESFQSRSGDEIHLNDTINEMKSLSERFGINLLFQKPTNEEYIDIVLELAKDKNLETDERFLIEKAKRMALVKGSNSPRVAKQLIDNLLANVGV